MGGGETGNGDGLSRLHPELDGIQQQLQAHLVLMIAPGHADGDDRLALLEDDGGRQGDSRPFAGSHHVGVALPGVQADQASPVGDTGASALIHLAAPPAGRGRHHVAPAVGHHAGGGIAGPSNTPRSLLARHLDRAHAMGISRTDLERGLPEVDQRTAQQRVPVRQEVGQRHLHKTRISVVEITVGQGQLHGLGDDMNVVGGKVTHLPQVVTLQQSQGLGEIGPLGPDPGLADGIAAIVNRDRLLHPGPVGGQILLPQQSAMFPVPGVQLLGNVSPVEAVGNGAQPLHPSTLGLVLGLDQAPQRSGQLRVPGFLSRVQDLQHRAGSLGEGSGAVTLQRGHAQVDDRRDRRGLEVVGVSSLGDPADLAEMLQRRQLGGRSLTREHLHGFTPGVVNEKRDLSTDAILPVIGHAQRQDDGHRGIGGVAAVAENFDPGVHRPAVAGGHRPNPTRSVPTHLSIRCFFRFFRNIGDG